MWPAESGSFFCGESTKRETEGGKSLGDPCQLQIMYVLNTPRLGSVRRVPADRPDPLESLQRLGTHTKGHKV